MRISKSKSLYLFFSVLLVIVSSACSSNQQPDPDSIVSPPETTATISSLDNTENIPDQATETIPTQAMEEVSSSETSTPMPSEALATPTMPANVPSPPTTAVLNDVWERPVDGMEMLYVPAGTFLMGSDPGEARTVDNRYIISVEENELPQHAVTLGQFWIDRYEVTLGQLRLFRTDLSEDEWRSFAGRQFGPRGLIDNWENYPAMITWPEAWEYCEWVGGSLPTEAQWEYAARGPENFSYPWGNQDVSCELANYSGCSACYTRNNSNEVCEQEYLSEVARHPFSASWVGAEDMIGNVGEWVQDWYSDDYYSVSPSSNPPGPEFGLEKVLRGGGRLTLPGDLRAAVRFAAEPQNQYAKDGVRCAYVPDTPDNVVPTPLPSPTPSSGASSQIAFEVDDAIYVMDRDGSNQAPLPAFSAFDSIQDFRWSSDHSKIVVIGNGYNLYTLNADGSNLQQLLSQIGNSVSWSPDGEQLVADRNGNLLFITTDPGNVELLPLLAKEDIEEVLPSGDLSYLSDVSWSPDGSLIVFNASSQICVVRPDGNGLTVLAEGLFPTWSPDGKQIAYTSMETGNIMIMNADGSNVTPLTASVEGFRSYPSWSPDGDYIIFTEGSDDSSSIYIVNVDGTGLEQLTGDDVRPSRSVWIP